MYFLPGTSNKFIKSVFYLIIQGKEAGYDEFPMDEVLVGLIGVICVKIRDQRKKAMMMEALSKTQQALLLGATDLQYAEVLTSLYYIQNNF